MTRDTLVARIAQAAAAKYVLHISWVMGLGGACLFDCNLLKLSVDMLDVLQMMQRVCLMKDRTNRVLWQLLNEMATMVFAIIAGFLVKDGFVRLECIFLILYVTRLVFCHAMALQRVIGYGIMIVVFT